MLHLYELASLLQGMVEYCKKGFIPYPISVKKMLLGTSKDLGKKASYRDPRFSSNGEPDRKVNTTSNSVSKHFQVQGVLH